MHDLLCVYVHSYTNTRIVSWLLTRIMQITTVHLQSATDRSDVSSVKTYGYRHPCTHIWWHCFMYATMQFYYQLQQLPHIATYQIESNKNKFMCNSFTPQIKASSYPIILHSFSQLPDVHSNHYRCAITSPVTLL